MKLARREFVELLGASVASLSVGSIGLGAAMGAEGTQPKPIVAADWRLKLSPVGDIVSLTDGKLELVNFKLGDNHPRIVMPGKALYDCCRPTSVRQEGAKSIFHYAFAERHTFTVDYEVELVDLHDGTAAVRQGVKINAPQRITDGVMLVLPRNIQLPCSGRTLFVPLKNGVGRRKPIGGLDSEDEYVFRFAGGYDGGRPQSLAIPMLDEYAPQTDLHLTFVADPFFTSHLTFPFEDKIGVFHCIYPGNVGVKSEERTVYTGLHRGDARTAMKLFYATALADVEQGPDWLHTSAGTSDATLEILR